eukprot:jgi/Chlat1/2380/Chrsp17S02817
MRDAPLRYAVTVIAAAATVANDDDDDTNGGKEQATAKSDRISPPMASKAKPAATKTAADSKADAAKQLAAAAVRSQGKGGNLPEVLSVFEFGIGSDAVSGVNLGGYCPVPRAGAGEDAAEPCQWSLLPPAPAGDDAPHFRIGEAWKQQHGIECRCDWDCALRKRKQKLVNCASGFG